MRDVFCCAGLGSGSGSARHRRVCGWARREIARARLLSHARPPRPFNVHLLSLLPSFQSMSTTHNSDKTNKKPTAIVVGAFSGFTHLPFDSSHSPPLLACQPASLPACLPAFRSFVRERARRAIASPFRRLDRSTHPASVRSHLLARPTDVGWLAGGRTHAARTSSDRFRPPCLPARLHLARSVGRSGMAS